MIVDCPQTHQSSHHNNESKQLLTWDSTRLELYGTSKTVWDMASCKPVFLTETPIKMKVRSLGLISSQGSNTDNSPYFLNRVQVLLCWDLEWDLSDTTVHS